MAHGHAAAPSQSRHGLHRVWLGFGRPSPCRLSIVEADKLRDRADARRLLAQTLYAKRGTIYDRNGNVLTSSVECRNIAVNPQLIEDVDKTVSALVKATGIDKKTCRELVESDGTWCISNVRWTRMMSRRWRRRTCQACSLSRP